MGQKLPSLNHLRVLIVEDEPFIALDLAQMVEEADGVPVGPAATVRRALELIADDGISAAILDVDLPDGDIGPVLAALEGKGVQVVIHTGAGMTEGLRARYPDLTVISKPATRAILTRAIAPWAES